MPTTPSDKARRSALDLSAKALKGKGAQPVRSVRSAVDESGRVLHRFTTFDGKDPNGPRHIVVVDDDGTSVDSATLSPVVTRALGEEPAGPLTALARPIATAAASASIDPRANDLVLELGDVQDEIVTVTIPEQAGVSRADVYLLADTTGSMSTVLAAVAAGANAIVGAPFAGVDIAFGVGNYRDLPADDPPFTHQVGPTTDDAAVTAAIGTWSASGGNDIPEGQLYALQMLAEPPGGAIGWRENSKRIIVWFGDAPGHDPICAAISGLGFDITESSATARLVDEDITVVAISTDTGTSDALDGDPTAGSDYSPTCSIGGMRGQATRISTATGGQHVSGINADEIVDTIIDLIESAVLNIGRLTLEPSAAVAPFVESIAPASYGPLPGDREHVLPFEVRWRGVRPCAEEESEVLGGLNAVADGTVIARKPVRITVPACPPEYVYVVKYVCGTASDCGCPEAPVRPGRYATDIDLHNPSRHTARVSKRVTPLVTAGIGVGREPRRGSPAGRDLIRLQPHEATMDDCVRLAELHYGAPGEGALPLTVGMMEIVSTQQLVVTAVYTATAADGGLSIDVETVEPLVRPQLPSRLPRPVRPVTTSP